MSYRSRPQQTRPPAVPLVSDYLTDGPAEFVAACIQAGLNLVVAGKPRSGKTAFVTALSTLIRSSERVVTIERTADLRIAHPEAQSHLVPMDDRPELVRGIIESEFRGSAGGTWSRLIVDELTCGNATEILTGMGRHPGWLATGVADSAADLLARLPVAPGAIEVIVTLARYASGSRVVSAIAEVVREGDRLAAVELFNRTTGSLQATGVVPACLAKLRQRGQFLSPELFKS